MCVVCCVLCVVVADHFFLLSFFPSFLLFFFVFSLCVVCCVLLWLIISFFFPSFLLSFFSSLSFPSLFLVFSCPPFSLGQIHQYLTSCRHATLVRVFSTRMRKEHSVGSEHSVVHSSYLHVLASFLIHCDRLRAHTCKWWWIGNWWIDGLMG